MLIKENHSLYKRQENRQQGRQSRANRSQSRCLKETCQEEGEEGGESLMSRASMAITPNECDRYEWTACYAAAPRA